MSGLGIHFGNESEGFDTNPHIYGHGSSFNSQTVHIPPKKPFKSHLRYTRPQIASEQALRVPVVSGEPGNLGHRAWTDDDPLAPLTIAEEIVLEPHKLHSLNTAVAAMHGHSTDTATPTDTECDPSPTLTESSLTTPASSSCVTNMKPHMHASLPKKPSNDVINASRARATASHRRISVRGATRRKGSLRSRLGPRVGSLQPNVGRTSKQEKAGQIHAPEDVSDGETEVMIPDGFGGYTRTKLPRSQLLRGNLGSVAIPRLQEVATASERSQPEDGVSRPTLRVGSLYGHDGFEKGGIDSKIGASSATASTHSSVFLSCSRTSSSGPKAKLMRSPIEQAHFLTRQNETFDCVEESPKVAAAQQHRLSRMSLVDVALRSKRSLQGLDQAERGQALVSLDRYRMTYDAGLSVVPHEIVALDQEHDLGANDLSAFDSKMDTGSDNATERTGGKARNRLQKSLSEANITGALLGRQSTLFSATANPLRRSKDLDRLLGNSDRKLPSSAARQVISEGHTKGVLKRSNAVAATGPLPPPALEQGKASKARVEVDLVLESDLVVEGGTLQGRMQIRIRKGSVKEGAVLLAQPKVRIVGFEELLTDDTRHIFYHHASLIDGDSSRDNVHRHGSPTFASPETAAFPALPCYAGAPDAEGYAVGKIGIHSIPFSLDLPIAKGAKGSYRCKHAVVRYIVIGSVKLKSTSGADRSIAHFYRHIDVYPYFNPAVILSKAVQPIQASSSKGLFLGGSGKVHLMASLHRSTWVAGQRLYVNIAIQNDTSKKINGMSLSLMRTVTLYKPRPELELDGHRARKDIDPDACQTSTNRKKIAEEQLEMGQKGSKGAVTARGWWVGVEPGQRVESSHHMLIPADAMSISRGRLVEVVYSIKVSIGSSLSSDVSVELPVRVVNFVSLDPPPLKKAGGAGFAADAPRGWAANHISPSGATSLKATSERMAGIDADQKIARVKSVEAMRSPGKTGISLHNHDQHLQADRTLSPRIAASEQTRRLQHQKSLDFIHLAVRSAAARRGVDVTPMSSSSRFAPSPTGLGIGLLMPARRSGSGSVSSCSPGLSTSSSTAGTSTGGGPEYDDDLDTPMASTHYSGATTMFPSDRQPYEQQHGRAHQAHLGGTYSHLPVHLHLPTYLHPQKTYQLPINSPSCRQKKDPGPYTPLPILQINNAKVLSLDEIWDDYDDRDDGQEQADHALALNDESMAEMNMVIGSARLDYQEFCRYDDSMHVGDVWFHADEHMLVLEQVAEESGSRALRRHTSADEEERREADEVAEVPLSGPTAGTHSAARSSIDPRSDPTCGDMRPYHTDLAVVSNFNRPLTVAKGATSSSAGLPHEQVIQPNASTDRIAKRSSMAIIPIASRVGARVQRELSAVNLKRHSDNLSHRQQLQLQQQTAVQSRHRSTHSVTGLKPLILRSRATSDGKKDRLGSSTGSRTPDTAAVGKEQDEDIEVGPKTPDTLASDVPVVGRSAPPSRTPTRESKAYESSTPGKLLHTPRHPMSPAASLLRPYIPQAIVTPTKTGASGLRHSDSASSLISVSTASACEVCGLLSRSHSSRNLRGTSIVVPSVRNKIAMLEGRSAALREFAGHTASNGSSPAASPIRSPVSIGTVSHLAARAERASSSTPSKLGRKSSCLSMTKSEDAISVVSSAVTVPEYMKQTASGIFNAPVLRNLR